MPNWTLGEIMSNATQRVGRRADIPASTVSFWVNAAYQDVCELAPHSLQESIAVSSTTSGENRFALPNDFKEMITLSFLTDVGSSRTLRQMSAYDADAIGYDDIGEPDRYVLFNDFIELFPSPNSAYSLQLRYRTWPPDLTSTASVPSVSTPYRKAIMFRAEQYLHEYLGDFDAATASEFRYQQYLSQLDNDMARRQRSQDRFGVRAAYGGVRR